MNLEDILIEQNPELSDQPQPQAKRGSVGEVATGLLRGAAVQLPVLIGQGMKWFSEPGADVYELGESLRTEAQIRGENPDMRLQPEAHGVITNSLAGGAEMLVPSVGPQALAVLGDVLFPPAAPYFHSAAAAGTGALFGASQAQDSYERVLEETGDKGKARLAGLASGSIEAGGEAAASLIGGKYLTGALKLLGPKKGMTIAEQVLLRARNPKALAAFGKATLLNAASEVGTEMGQNAGEVAVERAAGVTHGPTPGEAAVEAISPTLGLSALMLPFGGVGAYRENSQTRKMLTVLENSKAPVEERTQAAAYFHNEIAQRDQEAADLWAAETLAAIGEGKPLAVADEAGANRVDKPPPKPSGPLSKAVGMAPPKPVVAPVREVEVSAGEMGSGDGALSVALAPEEGLNERFEDALASLVDEGDIERGNVDDLSGLRQEIGGPSEEVPAVRGAVVKPEEREAYNRIAATNEELPTPVDAQAHEAATSPANDTPEPTVAQIEAGNYKKGHVLLHGLDISVENPRGSERSGTDPNGKPWSVRMPAHYGYIRRTEGADGDHVDVYIGNQPESSKVFVVDQVDHQTGHFDEHKVLLGLDDAYQAASLYRRGFADMKGNERIGAMTEMDMDQFKIWLKNGDTTKPLNNSVPMVQVEPVASIPVKLNFLVMQRQAREAGLKISKKQQDGSYNISGLDDGALKYRAEDLTGVYDHLNGNVPGTTAKPEAKPPVVVVPDEIDSRLNLRPTGGKRGGSPVYAAAKIDPSIRRTLEVMRDEISAGEAGSKIFAEGGNGTGGTQEVMATPSTFPEYFSNKGYTKMAALAAIDRYLDGQGITSGKDGSLGGQAAMLADLVKEKRGIDAGDLRNLRQQQIEARRAEAEMFAVDEEAAAENIALAKELYSHLTDEEAADMLRDDMFALVPKDQINALESDYADTEGTAGQTEGVAKEGSARDVADAGKPAAEEGETKPVLTEQTEAGEQVKLFATPPTFGKKTQGGEAVSSLDFDLEEEAAGLFEGGEGGPAKEKTVEPAKFPGDKAKALRRYWKRSEDMDAFRYEMFSKRLLAAEDGRGHTDWAEEHYGAMLEEQKAAEEQAGQAKSRENEAIAEAEAIREKQRRKVAGEVAAGRSENKRMQAWMDTLDDPASEALRSGGKIDHAGFSAFISTRGGEFERQRGRKVVSKEDQDALTKYIRQWADENLSERVRLERGAGRSSNEKTEPFGAGNKLVTQDRAAELKAKLRAKLTNELRSGIDPEILALGTELAVFYVEGGVRSFTKFSRQIVAELGEAVKPYLKSWYMGARYFPGLNVEGMDTAATVEALNVDEITEDSRLEEPAKEPVQGKAKTVSKGVNVPESAENHGDYFTWEQTDFQKDLIEARPPVAGKDVLGVDDSFYFMGGSNKILQADGNGVLFGNGLVRYYYPDPKKWEKRFGFKVEGLEEKEKTQARKLATIDLDGNQGKVVAKAFPAAVGDGLRSPDIEAHGFTVDGKLLTFDLNQRDEIATAISGAIKGAALRSDNKMLRSVADKVMGYEESATSADNSDKIPIKEIADVNDQRSRTDLERNSADAGSKNRVGKEDVSDDGGADGRAGEQGVPADEGGGSAAPGGGGLFGPEAAAAGKRGDFSPYSEHEQSISEDSLAGSDDGERGGNAGLDGLAPDHIPTETVGAAATGGVKLISKRKAQKQAQSVKVILADPANIDESLPFIHDGQRADVAFAEERFALPEGYGVLFTNGTGTGKTYSGLGIAKRFERQGKTNILIAVPDAKAIDDWKESGKNLDLDITELANTKDHGRGIVVTTYANLGQNDALARRDWDLILSDESHNLMQAKDGKETLSLASLRALSNHPRGKYQKHHMLHRKEIDELKRLREQHKANAKLMNLGDTMDQMVDALRLENERIDGKIEKLLDTIEVKRKALFEQIDGAQGAGRTRVVFLSATPFAYEKNVDYAEGYLFDYPEDGHIGNSRQGGFEKFMVEHFGYRIRYHKLNEPGPEVNRGLMQRQFNSWLKKQKVLSGRMLDVDQDYDRKFVLTENAIGAKIDEGLQLLWDNKRYHDLHRLVQDKFDHLSRRYLLEAIKAREVIPLVKEHLALGRKVVVFHDYKKGGGFNPFDLSAYRTSEKEVTIQETGEETTLGALVQEFESERPDLANLDLRSLVSPIASFSKHFDDVLLVNGDRSKKEILAAYERFNDDASGPLVALVQSAKNAGWSGHDTTGKHQRALFNLGLPTRPTMAIQQEGRIYRVGQMSNALFRYLNTGTNWERFAFATTIASRSSTAENLALGEEARALMDAFIQAFEESDFYPAGHEGEGTGGKERDRAASLALSEWDRATTMYFAQHKKTSRTKAMEGKDYFATPEPLGLKMVEWAGIRGGESALEPSAGHGAIARWFPENIARTVIEPSSELASRLKMVTDAKLLQETFENFHVVNKFDAIVMNPPFGVGGKTAIEHLDKATTHLREGGRVVALIPTGPAADKRFDKWFYEEDAKGKSLRPDLHLAAVVSLPQVTFERAGTKVAARIVVIDKLSDPAEAVVQVTRDYSNAETVKEFFERIEEAGIDRPQTKARQAEEEAEAAAAPTVEGGFNLAETTHAKKGITLFVATPTERLEREDFNDLRKAAKGHGGYWSSYRAQGAIPGFQFESAAARQAFVEAATDVGADAPKFNRKDSVGRVALSDVEFDAVFERITARMENTHGIVVAPTASALPPRILTEIQKQGSSPNEIDGVFHRGRVYIVRDHMTSAERLEEVLFHEMHGHAGLFAMMGNDSEAARREMVKLYGMIKPGRMLAIAKKNGFSLTQYAKGLREAGYDDDTRHAVLMEEMLAHLTREYSKGSIAVKVQEIIGRIRAWLRDHGFATLAEWGDTDIAFLLKRARTYAEAGVWAKDGSAVLFNGQEILQRLREKGVTDELLMKLVGGDTKFSTAWHGSPHDHDKFDMSKVGTGEGAQAYGYGHYFAGKKDVAEHYRYTLAKSKAEDMDPEDMAEAFFDALLKKSSFDDAVAAGPDAREYTREEFVAAWLDEEFEPSDFHATVRDAVEKRFAGRLYEVELVPEEDEYLLWDKTLSEQSAKVREALENEIVGYPDFNPGPSHRGSDIYTYFSREVIGSDQATSEYLHSLGIRGIKYLDGTSRDKGEGDYNYVIFDDADVEITAKFLIRDKVKAGSALVKKLGPDKAGLLFETLSDMIPERMKAAVGSVLSNPHYGSKKSKARSAAYDLALERGANANEIKYEVMAKQENYEGLEGLRDYYGKSSKAEKALLDKLLVEGDIKGAEYTEVDLDGGNNPLGKAVPEVVKRAYLAFRQTLAKSTATMFDRLGRLRLLPYEDAAYYQELVDLLDEDLSSDEVARRFGINQKAVDAYVKIRQGRVKLDAATKPYRNQAWYSTLRDALIKGLSGVQMQHEFGKTPDLVKAYFEIQKHGLLQIATAEKFKKAQWYKTLADLLTVGDDHPMLQKLELYNAYLGVKGYDSQLAKLKDQWHQAKGYLPRIRKDGEQHVKVFKVDDDGTYAEVWMQPAKSKTTARWLKEKVEKDLEAYIPHSFDPDAHYEVAVEPNTATPEEIFLGIGSHRAIEALLSKVFDKATDAGIIENQLAVQQQVLNILADEISARGFGRHRIARAGWLIEGYETQNTPAILSQFVGGMAGWLSKSEFAMRANKLMTQIPADKPQDKVWVRQYVDDALKNSTYIDQWFGTARSFAALMYLGFKTSSAFLNATQNYIWGQAKLSSYTKGATRKLLRAQHDVIKDHLLVRAGKNGILTEEERWVLEQGSRRGRSQANYVRSMAGMDDTGGVMGKGQAGIRWLAEKAMTPFQAVETYWNREPALLAAYRVFKAQGMSKEDALKKAEGFVDDVHFVVGKENIPAMLRKMGPLGRTLYTFQSYTHNYLLGLLSSLGKGEFQVVMRSMTALVLFGGLAAVPFGDDLDKWYRRIFGERPLRMLDKWLRDTAGQYMDVGDQVADFVLHGAPALAGVNFSRAIGVNIPWLSPEDDSLAERVTGVWGGLAQKVNYAGQAASRGDFWRSAEFISPEALANILRSYRLYADGTTTLSGRPVFGKDGKQAKYTAKDAAIRAFGFMPLEPSKQTQDRWDARLAKEFWSDRKADVLAKFRTAKDRKAAMKLVRQFNRELREAPGGVLVPPISISTLRQALRARPDKREMAYMR